MFSHIIQKSLAAAGAVVLSASLLSACGGSTDNGTDEGLGTKENPVTLTFWTWQPTDSQWKQIYKAFENEYPNIKIKWWRTSEQEDYQKKLQTAMAGGQGPDVFGIQAGSMVDKYGRFALDMNKVSDKHMKGWKSQISSSAVAQVTSSNGKLTAMPTITSGSEYLLYNKTLLRENGIKTVPKTYLELKKVCDELSAKGQIPMALGAKDDWHLDDLFVWLCNQIQPGDIYKAEKGKMKFTSPTFVKAMDAWKRMVDDKIFEDGAVGVSTYPDARDNYFYARKTAFFPTGSWHVSATIANDETKGTAIEKDELGMIPFPRVGAKDTPTTGVDFALSISKDSKKEAAAMKFIEFMTTGKGQQLWVNTLQGSPVDKKVKVQLPKDAPDTAREAVSEITKGQSSTKFARKLNDAELNEEISVQMQNIYTGSSSVQKALDSIESVIEGQSR